MSGTGNLQVTSRSDMLSSFLVYIYIYMWPSYHNYSQLGFILGGDRIIPAVNVHALINSLLVDTYSLEY